MNYKEIKKDLFSVDNSYAFAHCISSDFAMGAGIAVKFSQMGIRDTLIKHYNYMRIAYAQDQWKDEEACCLAVKTNQNRVVFNLVTKQRYFNKPTYKSLECSLKSMKQLTLRYDINKIAMPKIGCGLDRLEWNKVKEIIKDVFKDTDVEILICSL